MNTAVQQAQPAAQRQGIVQWAAEAYGIDAGKVMVVLKQTCFSQGKNEDPPSDAEVAALLIVAREHNLNPFLRQIYAFKNKSGGIVPVVGVDGYAAVVNARREVNGFDFKDSDEKVDHKGKKVPEWIECTIYRRDRDKHPAVREYFLECVRDTQAWNQTPSRMLRHRAFMQAGRVTLGLTLTDEEDGARIAAEPRGGQVIDLDVSQQPTQQASRTQSLAGDLAAKAKAKGAEDATVVEQAKPPVEKIDQETGEITVNPEGIRVAIESATEQGELALILNNILKLPAGPEREAIMVVWNAKVQQLNAGKPDPIAEKKPAVDQAAQKRGEDAAALAMRTLDEAKPKPKNDIPDAFGGPKKQVATREIADTVLKQMREAPNAETLDEIADAANVYDWPPNLRGEMNTAYRELAEKFKQ